MITGVRVRVDYFEALEAARLRVHASIDQRCRRELRNLSVDVLTRQYDGLTDALEVAAQALRKFGDAMGEPMRAVMDREWLE